MKNILTYIIAFLMPLFAFGHRCEGVVYDAQTNAPLANVTVTDGRNVTKTDENGKYELPGWGKSHFITVTVPSGYTTDTFYIPVEKDKKEYNFYLTKDERSANADHTFVQISDSEIGSGGAGEWLDHVKKTAEDENAAFLIHTGDICYTDGLKQHIKDMNSETMGLPVHYVIGNHDYVDGKYGEELFESIYGPTWYSFEVGNTHYVTLPFYGGDYASIYKPGDGWRWLKNDLENTAPDKNIVIFSHNAPPENHATFIGLKKFDITEYNVLAWLYGHYHYNDITVNDGIIDISTARPDTGGIDQSVAGTRVVHINENGELTSEMSFYDFKPNEAAAPENAVWSTQLDGNGLFCDTLIYGNKLYVGTSDDGYPLVCGVSCLDPETGKIIWQYETEYSIKNNIVALNDTIIAQDTSGNVYCLNAQTGSKIWQHKVKLNGGVNTTTGICTDGENVFVGSPRCITAINGKTGKFVWNRFRKSGENSPAEFVCKDGVLLVSSNWNALVAMNSVTGEEMWSVSDEDIRFRSSTPYITDDGRVIVADSDAIEIIDLKTGEVISKTDIENFNFGAAAQPVIDGDIGYFATADTGVIAFDLKEEKILWQVHTDPALISTPQYVGHKETVENLIIYDGKLIFGGSDGNLYIVNSADGKVLSKTKINAPILNNVSVYEDSVIVFDFAGRVSRIKIK